MITDQQSSRRQTHSIWGVCGNMSTGCRLISL